MREILKKYLFQITVIIICLIGMAVSIWFMKGGVE